MFYRRILDTEWVDWLNNLCSLSIQELSQVTKITVSSLNCGLVKYNKESTPKFYQHLGIIQSYLLSII
jgi:hypothetical protein